jgi:hypothetical protein
LWRTWADSHTPYGGGLSYIYGALIERGDHLVGAARDRNEVELDLLAGKESFLLGDRQIERRHASYGRGNLPVPKRHGISGRGRDRDAEPHRDNRLARDIARHIAHDPSRTERS